MDVNGCETGCEWMLIHVFMGFINIHKPTHSHHITERYHPVEFPASLPAGVALRDVPRGVFAEEQPGHAWDLRGMSAEMRQIFTLPKKDPEIPQKIAWHASIQFSSL